MICEKENVKCDNKVWKKEVHDLNTGSFVGVWIVVHQALNKFVKKKHICLEMYFGILSII